MISVGLIEDTDNYSTAVASLLQLSDEVQLAGIWKDAESALVGVPELLPDVVLTDIQLPGINGIECIRKLKMDCPNIQFMILTVFEEDEKIFEALNAGATGYLLKSASPEVIFNSIKEIHNGGSPMSPGIARRIIRHFQPSVVKDGQQIFTVREKQVLDLMAEGKLVKEIAANLNVTIHAIKKHIKNIYVKMHVQNKVEAVMKWKFR
ncbi:MAG: Two component transcriptional regulator, LuxR family [Mucilaginibacter sp.]|nr:Two component transcriptional regulator, LuxR family [Mucilaginibacter sp.]MDB5139845.1 Two component transcriptional regulator, LuxR family [Mucilaginibacter sp.]